MSANCALIALGLTLAFLGLGGHDFAAWSGGVLLTGIGIGAALQRWSGR